MGVRANEIADAFSFARDAGRKIKRARLRSFRIMKETDIFIVRRNARDDVLRAVAAAAVGDPYFISPIIAVF